MSVTWVCGYQIISLSFRRSGWGGSRWKAEEGNRRRGRRENCDRYCKINEKKCNLKKLSLSFVTSTELTGRQFDPQNIKTMSSLSNLKPLKKLKALLV